MQACAFVYNALKAFYLKILTKFDCKTFKNLHDLHLSLIFFFSLFQYFFFITNDEKKIENKLQKTQRMTSSDNKKNTHDDSISTEIISLKLHEYK